MRTARVRARRDRSAGTPALRAARATRRPRLQQPVAPTGPLRPDATTAVADSSRGPYRRPPGPAHRAPPRLVTSPLRAATAATAPVARSMRCRRASGPRCPLPPAMPQKPRAAKFGEGLRPPYWTGLFPSGATDPVAGGVSTAAAATQPPRDPAARTRGRRHRLPAGTPAAPARALCSRRSASRRAGTDRGGGTSGASRAAVVSRSALTRAVRALWSATVATRNSRNGAAPSGITADVASTGTPPSPSSASRRSRSRTQAATSGAGSRSDWLRATTITSRCAASGRR